jgi:hypothetical protein
MDRFQQKNEELREHGQSVPSLWKYLNSGHFYQATFGNRETEFLQMAIYVFALAHEFNYTEKTSIWQRQLPNLPQKRKRFPNPVPKTTVLLQK